jgi:hypothetical protein
MVRRDGICIGVTYFVVYILAIHATVQVPSLSNVVVPVREGMREEMRTSAESDKSVCTNPFSRFAVGDVRGIFF